ncbi:MAG: heme exporter protein CcmB [Gammaproteobacteria bacterium]|nr:heme exporter protein CcmB [Gammaproteobacteria bacterium]
MFHNLLVLIHHDILITLRQAYSWLTPLLFFVLVVCLFPLALGPDTETLNKIAPGIIWVAALLAILMSLGNIFRNDVHEGYLDLILLSSTPLTLLVFCKVISHWITHCLPLILISPLLGVLLNLNNTEELTLITTLLLGTPVLCLLGAIGSALIVSVRTQGLLLPILIMPLYIPVLIFSTSAMMAASLHQPLSAYFAILGAIALFTLVFAPFLTSAALRIGVNQ